MKRVLFLDIDGVLNSDPDLDKFNDLGAGSDCITIPHLQALEKLLAYYPETKIVVSSDWRLPQFPCALKMVKMCLAMIGHTVYGVTPDMGYTDRSVEILTWIGRMQRKKVHFDRFCILDDRYDAGSGVEDHLVRTDPRVGLTESNVLTAVGVLGDTGPCGLSVEIPDPIA